MAAINRTKETPVPDSRINVLRADRTALNSSRSNVRFFVSLFVVRDEVFFVGIDDKDGQQACGLSLTVICADAMMIAR